MPGKICIYKNIDHRLTLNFDRIYINEYGTIRRYIKDVFFRVSFMSHLSTRMCKKCRVKKLLGISFKINEIGIHISNQSGHSIRPICSIVFFNK